MKHFISIFIRNFISPITIAIFLLSAVLLALGEAKDAWFVSVVIIINTVLACAQEIRAYLMLKKLELMSAPKAMVLRGDEYVEVMYDELTVDEEIKLKAGDEVPADAEILTTKGLEVDESMLTGESNSVAKKTNDNIWASSAVMAGSATAKIIAIGNDTRAGQMTAKLKKYKPVLTPLQKKISNAISILTYFALFLALLIFFVYQWMGHDYITTFRTITTAAVVVVPEGLLLASSMLFAYGSMRLSMVKVLPQKLSAIEGMALLEVLATDKTGTLTSPEIKFDHIDNLSDYSESQIKSYLWLIAQETGGDNMTSQAIIAGLTDSKPADYNVASQLAFSSARKFSGIQSEVSKTNKSLIFGAPEYVLKTASDDISESILQTVNTYSEQGYRVLLLAEYNEYDKIDKLVELKVPVIPIAIVLLKNELRENVAETVDFLQKRGVSLRVISGDNPRTVSFVAKEAGINNPDSFITGEELTKLSDNQFERTVLETTIFARVLPDQKEQIIEIFKKNKKYTGMVGDGVNDALAIKASDLGVAMFAGSPATRRVADIVLLDNSFTALPEGMKIGNRIMQAIEMIAILFFHKIILGVTLLITTMILGVNYPFFPRHITFMNFILVTLPTVVVTLFPPLPKHRINPKFFWRDTLLSIAPIAVLSGLTVAIVYWVSSISMPGNEDHFAKLSPDVLTTVVIVASYFGSLMTIVSSVILGASKNRNALMGRILYLIGVVLFVALSFGTEFMREFFNFSIPQARNWFFILFIIGLVTIVQLAIAKVMKDRIQKREKLTE